MPYSRTTATAALAASQLPKGTNSVVELLTRVPVNRGSLVKSIENLLKTIESSENAVMIPTLLRDKVRVDAWELLFVAKILKASILGHGDLVEFYMNHLNGPQEGDEHQTQQQQFARGQTSPQMVVSPQLQHSIIYEQSPSAGSSVAGSSISTTSTTYNASSSSTPTNGISSSAGGGGGVQQRANSSAGTTTSSASWTTAQLGSQQAYNSAAANCSSSSSCVSAFSSISHSSQPPTTNGKPPADHLVEPLHTSLSAAEQPDTTSFLRPEFVGDLSQQPALELQAAKPLIATQHQQQRQAQPPSLLQLTTTNNHINSLLQSPPNLDQQQQQQQQQQQLLPHHPHHSNLLAATNQATNSSQDSQLTISTVPLNGGSESISMHNSSTPTPNSLQNQHHHQQQQQRHAELRTSRSAGCLFRANSSGASSPRTSSAAGGQPNNTAPNTPLGNLPEVVANGELPGDPSSLVKLLMQIEQLKASIAHVSVQLESVVELYKKSIDNIST